MASLKKISQEIVNALKGQKIHKVLLFGSYAKGQANDESDIDLLVVLDKQGISDTYRKTLENKKVISKQLRKLRKIIPIDLLVYTKDEWLIIKSSGSSFFSEIEKGGIALI